jgi:hypothetical protein
VGFSPFCLEQGLRARSKGCFRQGRLQRERWLCIGCSQVSVFFTQQKLLCQPPWKSWCWEWASQEAVVTVAERRDPARDPL